MSHFFEHQKSSFKRNYLRNLIVLASADGTLQREENALIHKIGIRRGLKPWQIEELFEQTTPHTLFLPESMANRMNMLYDLMELVYIDLHTNDEELLFVRELLVAFGLDPEIMETLKALFENGNPDPMDWRDFVDSVCCVSMA